MKKIRNQVTKFRAAVAVKVLQAKYKLFENTGEGYVAVSYTHLDVYKRQDSICAYSSGCSYLKLRSSSSVFILFNPKRLASGA